MLAAADLGAKKIILGIGGSATVDGGIGAAQAWGAKITLISGQSYTIGDRRLSGGDLQRLLRVSGNLVPQKELLMLEDKSNGDSVRHSKLKTSSDLASVRLETRGIEFVVACDVGNPLLGDNGAARIFGPQKGATPAQVEELEDGLHKLVERTGCQEESESPGAGAAGGLGFGMLCFFGASLLPGIDIVIDATHFRERLAARTFALPPKAGSMRRRSAAKPSAGSRGPVVNQKSPASLWQEPSAKARSCVTRKVSAHTWESSMRR